MTTLDVFLTQTGGVRTGEHYQHDEFSGFAVRSVDVSYNTPVQSLEDTYNRAFATAAVTDRTIGSNWFMPCFLDVDPTSDSQLFGQPSLGINNEAASLSVGDVVRFGSTYAGGSSPYCTILEKVPIHFLINDQSSTKAVVEYLPGLHNIKELNLDVSVDRQPNPTFTTIDVNSGEITDGEIKGLKLSSSTDNHNFHANHIVLRDATNKAGRDSALYTAHDYNIETTGELQTALGLVMLVPEADGGSNKFFVQLSDINKVYVGGYVNINIPDSGNTFRTTRVRVTEVSGFNNSEPGSVFYVGGVQFSTGAAMVKCTPSIGHEYSQWVHSTQITIVRQCNAKYVNLTCDAACYAYRINRTINLTSISNRPVGGWTDSVDQSNLHLGGISVPGEYRSDADTRDFTNRQRVFDPVHNTSNYSTSTVRSKFDYKDRFLSIPFLRAQELDLERCYYPVYRMKDWRNEKLQQDHPLRVKLDYDVKQVSRVLLHKYSIFGKRQIEKEDAAQMPDDDYFVLRIREVDGKVVSNNPNADRAFGIIQLGGDLSTSDNTGAQEFTTTMTAENVMVLDLVPPRKIQSLTLDVLDRDGNPAHFGRIHLWLKLEVQPCA